MIELKQYPGIDKDGQSVRVTIASGPVIIKDGKVLLDKHGSDEFWKFPGGRVRDNESLQETAQREAMEELALDVELSGDPLVLTFEREKDGVREIVVLFHYRATTNGRPHAQRDVREYAWHDISSLPDDCAPNVRPVVEAFSRAP